jgi:hypothetical protein
MMQHPERRFVRVILGKHVGRIGWISRRDWLATDGRPRYLVVVHFDMAEPKATMVYARGQLAQVLP